MADQQAQLYQTRTALSVSSASLFLFSTIGKTNSQISLPGNYFSFPGEWVFWILFVTVLYFLLSFIIACRAMPIEDAEGSIIPLLRKSAHDLENAHRGLGFAFPDISSETREEIEQLAKNIESKLNATIPNFKSNEGLVQQAEELHQDCLALNNHSIALSNNSFEYVTHMRSAKGAIRDANEELTAIEKRHKNALHFKEKRWDRDAVTFGAGIILCVSLFCLLVRNDLCAYPKKDCEAPQPEINETANPVT